MRAASALAGIDRRRRGFTSLASNIGDDVRGDDGLDRRHVGRHDELAKLTVIGRVTKRNLKAAVVPWTIKLNKTAAKAFKRKKTVKVTIKSTVTPPTGRGKPVVKTA